MNRHFFKKNRFIFAVLPFLIVAAYSIHETSAHQSGEVGVSRSGCGGGGCHGSKSTATVVSIYTDSPSIVVGHTYTFNISVANPNEAAAGCDITCDKGTLGLLGSNSGLWQPDISYGYPDIVQYQENAFTGDSAEWQFTYTAPKTAGTVHIYAAGNAVNGDQAADGADHWNTKIDTLKVVAAAGVNEIASSSIENTLYPNPSTGKLTLASNESGLTKLTVSDAAGRTVLSQEIMLGAETPLDFSVLPRGAYFLTVHANNGTTFTKNFAIEK